MVLQLRQYVLRILCFARLPVQPDSIFINIFCFQKHTNSNYGFTCGFDTTAVTYVPGIP